MLALGRELPTPPATVSFDLLGSGKRIAVLEPLVGRSGWLTCVRLSVGDGTEGAALLLAGVTDDGAELGEDQCRRLSTCRGRSEAR